MVCEAGVTKKSHLIWSSTTFASPVQIHLRISTQANLEPSARGLLGFLSPSHGVGRARVCHEEKTGYFKTSEFNSVLAFYYRYVIFKFRGEIYQHNRGVYETAKLQRIISSAQIFASRTQQRRGGRWRAGGVAGKAPCR